MDQRENRKQELARRLRVSERVLEQYLDLKNVESGGESESTSQDVAPELLARNRRRPARQPSLDRS